MESEAVFTDGDYKPRKVYDGKAAKLRSLSFVILTLGIIIAFALFSVSYIAAAVILAAAFVGYFLLYNKAVKQQQKQDEEKEDKEN